MCNEILKILEGPQPLKKEIKKAQIVSVDLPRDTAARGKFIDSMNLEKNFQKDALQKIYSAIDEFDAGHIVARSEGGTNNFDNFILEEKKENREPGKKREIERANQSMLQSRKTVENTFTFQWDKRMPVKVPVEYSITQVGRWRNGRMYQENNYVMGNVPYLRFATMPEMRLPLVKYDFNENVSYAILAGVYGGIQKSTVSNQTGIAKIKVAIKTGVKTALPYIARGAIKVTLDSLQTSKHLAQDVRNDLALLNVNKGFNITINNLTHFASLKILLNELKKQ